MEVDLENIENIPEDIYRTLVKTVLENNNEGIIFSNYKNEIFYVNKKFEEITGYKLAEIKGKTPKAFQSGIQEQSFYDEMKETVIKTGSWYGEVWNRAKNGELFLQSLALFAIRNDDRQIVYFVGIISDILRDHQQDDQLLLGVSYYDALTGLPNSMMLEKFLISSMKMADKKQKKLAIVYFQVHNFTEINAKYGLLFGDVLLKRIATRVKNYIGKNCMLTRWNGTEFALVINDVRNKQHIEERLQEINNRLANQYMINGNKIEVFARYGISVYPEDGNTEVELVAKATASMDKAEEEGEVFRFYEADFGSPQHFVMEFEIKKALEEQQLILYYQPLISLKTGKIVSYEALIRWNHPEQGLIPPAKFIPLAEKTGLIDRIGNFVLRTACTQLNRWDKLGLTDVSISVNISMNHFKNKNIITDFAKIIQDTEIDPSRIVLELTESALIGNVEETIIVLRQLSMLGLQIAVDDFGTGYSSIGYLIDFPINQLKIDRSFIEALETNAKIEAIVTAINTMAKTMEITVVAEGIETESQLTIVKKLECDIAQGYYFDKPLSPEEIEKKWSQEKH